MVEKDTSIHGSCLCGAVAYALSCPPGSMWHCHCVICRKLSGAAFATHVEAMASDFSWLCGHEGIRHYALSAAYTRSFCDQCGSVVPYVTDDRKRVLVPAGGLDDDPGVRPCAHGWVTVQAPWHAITDALPQFATSPPHLPACPLQSVRPPTRPGRRTVHVGVASVAVWSTRCAVRLTSSRTAIVTATAR